MGISSFVSILYTENLIANIAIDNKQRWCVELSKYFI